MIRLFFFLGVIHKIFQAHLGARYAKAKLAGKVVQKFYLRPHAARDYHINLQCQGYMARHTADNWGEPERAPCTLAIKVGIFSVYIY